MCQENLSFISIQCTIFLYICTALSTYMHSTKAYVVHKTQHCQPCLTNLLSAYIRHCHHQSYWYTTRCHLPKTSLIIHKTQCCSYGIKTFSFSINLKLQGHQPLRKVLSLPCPFSVVWHTHCRHTDCILLCIISHSQHNKVKVTWEQGTNPTRSPSAETLLPG